MGILDGKRVLVTGVLTDASIAFHVAKLAQREGATVVLTGFGRSLNLTRRISGRLPETAPVVELDVTNDKSVDAGVAAAINEVGHLDVVINNAGYALGGVTETVVERAD